MCHGTTRRPRSGAPAEDICMKWIRISFVMIQSKVLEVVSTTVLCGEINDCCIPLGYASEPLNIVDLWNAI